MLLYTSRGVSGTSHFRIRGLLPLRGMLVSAGEPAGGFGVQQPATLGALAGLFLPVVVTVLGAQTAPCGPSRQPWGHRLHLQDKPPTHLARLLPQEPLVGGAVKDPGRRGATLLLEGWEPTPVVKEKNQTTKS